MCKVRRGWLPVLLGVSLFACGPVPIANTPLPVIDAHLAAVPASFGDNRVELLTDGAVAAGRMRELMKGAHASIEAEIYEFDRADLADALVAALSRGVKVTLVEDPTVDVNAATAARLRRAGAEVLDFPVQQRQIDHVKLLIVDFATAVFGGMNWGSGSWRNRDFDLAVSGPSVAHLAEIFAADVIRSGGRAALAAAAPDPGGFRLVATYPEAQVRPAVLDAIAAAQTQVFIEMYVMTDSEVIAALSEAARRGVAVFVLFDPNQDLNQLAAARLRVAGVHARFYRTHGEKLHAKAMEVDRHRLIVGSANWTSSGFLHNHELDAAIESPELASQALARMESDWKASAN
jgi:phosphatidylserine/phosphatidylglycerophosphate/cardiolipin synthase-like enzyme